MKIIGRFWFFENKDFIMKSKNFSSLVILFCCFFNFTAFSQNTFPSSGRVGIGTNNPVVEFDLRGRFRAESNSAGYVGVINTTSNSWAELSLQNLSGVDGAPVKAQFKVMRGRVQIGSRSVNPFYLGAGDNKNHIVINPNGYVGIGTSSPDSKFSVNGKIHAKEVKVDMNGWSDFVFESDYELATLEEVNSFIQKNGYLKDIPNAAEVEKNGVLIGEMNAKLLQKIEELTLYIIDQNEKIKKQQLEMQNQSSLNRAILHRLRNLEGKI